MRRKSNFDYFLCLAKIENGFVSREDIFFIFDDISSKLLVALELHNQFNKIHFHVYLRTYKQVKVLIF